MDDIDRFHDLTELIIGCAFEVHRELGSGFLEKVYENALGLELQRKGIEVQQQRPISVSYKGDVVGEFVAALAVNNKVIVELKAVDKINDVHEIQLKNYLKATGFEVGLLINFGRSVEVRRKFVPKS